MGDEQNVDLGKLGRERFCYFCRTMKRVIQDEGAAFDCTVSAGNTGLVMAKYAELIYEYLRLKPPPSITIPLYRFIPGHEEDDANKFDNTCLLPQVVGQIKDIGKIESVLFIDDEIGRGMSATTCFDLLNKALVQLGKPPLKGYCIIADDHGFTAPAGIPQMKFIPYHSPGDYNNAIFFATPSELEKPIIGALGGDDVFKFHWRVNILFGLPLKDFNGGSPVYTDRFNTLTKDTIPHFKELQRKYLEFIKSLIRSCLE